MRKPCGCYEAGLLGSLLPLCVCLAVGAVLRRAGRDLSDALVELVVLVSLPALVLARVQPLALDARALAVPAFALGSIAAGAALGWVAGRALRWERRRRAALVLVCALGNTSFLGLPFVDGVAGPAGLPYAVLYDQLGSFTCLVVLGEAVVAWGNGRAARPAAMLAQLVRFPPFLALVAALALRGLALPGAVRGTLETLGATVSPLATIAVGMKLDLGRVRGAAPGALVALVIKMALVPALALGALWLAGASGLPARVVLLQAAMPPMVLAGVLAARGGLDADLAAAAVGLGVLASLASGPAWWALSALLG